jgi:hypothetical protein
MTTHKFDPDFKPPKPKKEPIDDSSCTIEHGGLDIFFEDLDAEGEEPIQFPFILSSDVKPESDKP